LGRLRGKLSKLERQAEPLRDDVTFLDGTILKLKPGERFDAFLAAMNEEEHWLMGVARRVGATEASPEFLRLLWALQPGPQKEEEAREE
jgi:hypothetical protein